MPRGATQVRDFTHFSSRFNCAQAPPIGLHPSEDLSHPPSLSFQVFHCPKAQAPHRHSSCRSADMQWRCSPLSNRPKYLMDLCSIWLP